MAPVTRNKTVSVNKPVSVVTNTTTGYSRHSTTTPLAKDAQKSVAKELQGTSIGPVPHMEFLKRYVPDHKEGPTTVRPDFFKMVSNEDREVDRYQPFIDTLNKCRKISGIKFVITSEKKEEGAKSHLKPDIVVYTTRQGKKTATVLKWADVEIIIEWKADTELDGFRKEFPDQYATLDGESDKAAQTRGQIYSYASEALENQHRLFILALTICGDYARFYRFDASSVVVSEPISIRDDADVIAEFFARYGCMTPAERGYDPTVTPATDSEEKLFQKCLDDYRSRVAVDDLRLHPDVKNLDVTKTVKIQVNNEEDGTIHSYLACKPKSSPVNYSPCGPFSRGFFAVPFNTKPLKATDPDKARLFWLKDCWRSDDVESETCIYRHLKENGVSNLPNIRCMGGVVVGGILQETLNDTLLLDETTQEWRRPVHMVHHMIHYRVVTELLIPLDAIRDAEELLLVGRVVVNTISDADLKAGVHHRNISKSSIMLTEGCETDGRWAILVDWDCAKRVGTNRTSWITSRTPSWQFLSVALLEDVIKPHDIFDDLESLYWVLLYIARQRFTFKGVIPPDFFDEHRHHENSTVGPVSKGGSKKNNWLDVQTLWFDCNELQGALTLYCKYLRKYTNLNGEARISDDKKNELTQLRGDPQKTINTLLSYFDDALEDPHASWDSGRAHGVPRKNKGTRAEDKAYFVSKERATRNGFWPGSYNYKPMPVGFGDDQAEGLTSETDSDVGDTSSGKADEDDATEVRLILIPEDDED